ncbi:esterase B1 [Papilio machaon]|uniref:esterase B1 n=1 Tax=Papilio machaon TaxID=76193 RepID=UPI001E665658|nr:esterase B1 [Papilio machaon]
MVQVKVREGILEGEVVENELGGHFYSFKGIPYAEPPLGELRFKPPQPKKSWDGVREAKKFGSICYQVNILAMKSTPTGSEDCLYLNVYSSDINPSKPLPVMFYIHGGGFLSGSGNDDMCGPEFLVRHEVVFVTFNYRLEVLGFLCLDTEDIPGNAGMKDQVAALRWVNENIANFGGDPNNITIFGHSAGACGVSYHLISPMTKGLFQKAIIMSGSLNSSWGQIFEPRERGLALARRLGCHSKNDKELYEFFKKQPVESLVNIQIPISFNEKGKELFEFNLGIVSEKYCGENERFIYGDVIAKLRNGIHEGIDLVMGYTKDEGLINLRTDLQKILAYANEYTESFVPTPIANNCTMEEQFEVGRKIKYYYFNDDTISMKNLNELIKFISLSTFTYPMFQLARSCSRNNRVYFYKFTGKSERNLMAQVCNVKKFLGDEIPVCHGDELYYIFPMKRTKLKICNKSKSFKIIDNVTKLLTNFAKFGNPTAHDSFDFEWSPYNSVEQAYLEINENLTMGTEPDKAEVDFWENIYRKYLPSSIPY